jgi:ASC-1-like (ASCH) protein
MSSASLLSPVADRLFVPLATEPFRWFASGRKQWELRRLGRQYTPKHVMPGRRVELRKGYVDKSAALWGTVTEICEADGITEFFDVVDFREVIPEAADRQEAEETAARILGSESAPVIGFRVDVDPVTELPLHSAYMLLVREGKKQSTVRKGIRKVDGAVADLVSGEDRVRVLVTDLNVKSFQDLSDEDAHRDGFNTLQELSCALRRFYPDIAPSDPVTIIGFDPVDENP